MSAEVYTPSPLSITRNLGYRRDIDGLRAIAVAGVVFYHAGVFFLSGGFVGVDIFFVISGYLIGAHIYGEISEDQFSIIRFYQRRAKRILPALLVLLVICYVVAFLLFSPYELSRLGRFSFATLISGSNILAWYWAGDYFGPATSQNPLIMTWTLSVEEQFYIILPLLLLLLSRVAKACSLQSETVRKVIFRTVFLLTLISFLLCTLVTFKDKLTAFYLIPFRAWELAIGVLMALYEANPKKTPETLYFGNGKIAANIRGWLGIGLILYAVLRFDATIPFPGPSALLPTIGAALLITAPTAFCNRRILSSWPLVGIGLVSYSWYLWHWPLMSFANIFAIKPLPAAVSVALALISLPIAWLSYRFVERPFRQSLTPPAKLLLRYGIVCTLVALPAALMVLTKGLPNRYPAAAGQERLQTQMTEGCFGDYAPNNSPTCLPKQDGTGAVALWGDSHAAALTPALTTFASRSGLRLLNITHRSCPPLMGVSHANAQSLFDHSCIDFNNATLKLLVNDHSVKTVVLAGFWSVGMNELPGYVRPDQHYPYQPDERRHNLQTGLHKTVSALQSAGKRVILIQDVPWLKFEPMPRLLITVISPRNWVVSHLLRQQANASTAAPDEVFGDRDAEAASIISQEATQDGVEVFDTQKQLCTANQCAFISNGDLLYRDYQHLTAAGSFVALQGISLGSR